MQDEAIFDNSDVQQQGAPVERSILEDPDFWKDDPEEEAVSEDAEEAEEDDTDVDPDEDESDDEEPEDGAEEEEEESEEQDGEAEEDQPEKPDPRDALWDKQLQIVQQLSATLERQLKSSEASGSMSAKDAAKAEKAVSKLAELLESRKDFDPYEDAKSGFMAVEEELQKRDALIEKMAAEVDALKKASRQNEQSLVETRFDKHYPELAGRYGELAKKAAEYAERIVGDDRSETANRLWERLAAERLTEIAEAEKTRATAQAEPKKKSAPVKKAKPKARPKVSGAARKPAASDGESKSYNQRVDALAQKYGFM